MCDMECPKACKYDGFTYNCSHQDLFECFNILSVAVHLRSLDLSYNNINHRALQNSLAVPFYSKVTLFLGNLVLSHNNIENVYEDLFNALPNLVNLDLGYNKITTISNYSFRSQGKLQSLCLIGNDLLKSIEPNAFVGLKLLTNLSITSTEIDRLCYDNFAGLFALKRLYLTSNKISEVENSAFVSLKSLVYLDLLNNRIQVFQTELFQGLSKFKTNDYR